MIRLNKFLSECGLSSRRKVEEYILKGRVTVNNKITKELYTKIDPENDIVHVDGELVKPNDKVYYVMNKPKGYVTTTSDEKNRKTVMELIDPGLRVYPVGRLDFNTSGVLFFTNDGDFTNFLLHPGNKIPRVYKVTLNKGLSPDHRLKFLDGIMLQDNKKGKFEKVNFASKKTQKVLHVVTVEGRNHFVKNMFKTLGYKVTNLARIKYAGIRVEDVPLGKYRKLSQEEVFNIARKYGSS